MIPKEAPQYRYSSSTRVSGKTGVCALKKLLVIISIRVSSLLATVQTCQHIGNLSVEIL